jgi:hypothetical protein
MPAASFAQRRERMNQRTLGALLPSLLADLEGRDGVWRGARADVPVYLLCDEEHNRMRIMAPIGEIRTLDPDFLALLLRANFDRALDAKFTMRDNEVWSLFVHPLSTLASDDLGLFLDQVVALVRNTGTTYASTELVFGLDEAAADDGEDFDLGEQEEDEEPEEGDPDAEGGPPA